MFKRQSDLRAIYERLTRTAIHTFPVVKQFELNYHWSLDQFEFATDIWNGN